MAFLQNIVRLPLRMIPRDSVVPIIQGPLRGKRWIVGSNVHGCWLGTYEHRTIQAFAVAVRPGNTVYDVGANVGIYSLLASARVGPAGTVSSFEPATRNLSYLRKHLELNGVRNCRIWETAVGNVDGTAWFDETADSRTGHIVSDPGGTIRVPIVKLDSLVESGQISPPDVIKIDIEGGEFDAISGAAAILESYKPAVFVETHSSELFQLCCRRLSDLRYRLAILDHPLSRHVHEVIAMRM